MARGRSVLDRHELYCPAPIVSGQASYGGVPKSVYKLTVMTGAISSFFALVAILVCKIAFGSFMLWMIGFPVIVTYVTGMGLTIWTSKRRDILVILKEAREFEKKERSA